MDNPSTPVEEKKPWYQQLNGYQWWVLLAAALGWLFDTMDQRLFVLARQPAIKELIAGYISDNTVEKEKYAAGGEVKTQGQIGRSITAEARRQKEFSNLVTTYGGYATAIFMVGWATGGLFFGVIGDRWGRVFTMLLTILIYSAFTGLSAFSTSWWDFAFYRFLSGVGVGGEFAAGVALVAEVMPEQARAYCLGILQALSAVGNIAGSLVGYYIGSWEIWTFQLQWLGISEPLVVTSWRLLFLIGILPALVVVLVRRNLEEPESWTAANEANEAAAREGKPQIELGSISELLGDPRWRYNVILGICLSLAGVVGLWGVGFWSPELIRNRVLANETPEVKQQMSAIALGLQDIGGFFGILAFSWVSVYMGRRPAFALSFIAAFAATTMAFLGMREMWHIYAMTPILGFCNLAIFGGFAIYFPELFPTRLRSTGTGFCYNVSRYVSAVLVLSLGLLVDLYNSMGIGEAFRYAAITVASIYLMGLFVLPFAPETKDRPLPE